MDNHIVNCLEVKIDELINFCRQLKQDNAKLYQQQSLLLQDYKRLQKKYLLAVAGIKKIVNQLKEDKK